MGKKKIQALDELKKYKAKKRFIRNIKNCTSSSMKRVNSLIKEDGLRYTIITSFVWESSIEGHEFWSKIHEDLLKRGI